MAKTDADVFKRIYVDGFIYNQSGNDEPNEHGILPIDTIWNTGQLPNRPLGLDLDETVFFDPTVKRVPSSNGSTKFVADIEKRWFNNNESYKTFRYQHIIVTPYLQTEEIWFGFSLLFPEDFDPDTHETIVYNFGGVGGGAFSLRVNNGYFHLSISRLDENTTSNRLIFVLEEANGGVWHDFIIKAKWSSNTADGELTVWKNGKLARLYNPVTRQKWVIPTSTTSGIQSQYIAFQEKGYINQTVEDEGSTVSVLNWKGFTLGINEGGIDHNFRTGFYYSGWNTNIDPVTGEVRPETYEEGDPLYIEPNMRIREMWTSNVGWQPKNSYTENFSHEDFYTSLDANNQLPLEKPNWWGDVPVDMFALEVRENPIEWGTAIDLTNESPYPEGTEVELQATPETWTQFYRWSRDGVTLSTNQNYLYTTRGQNDLVLGEFQPKQYPLVVTVTPIGGGTVNIESGNYTEGQQVPLVATNNTGYTFLNWQRNGEILSTNPSYTHTKTAGNETISAHFVLAKHQLTVTAGTGGTATGGGSFSQGETTSLQATAISSYQFDGWYRDNVKLSGDNPYTYTARNQPDTVQARFLRKAVAVIHADPESGTKPLTVQFSSSGSVADTYAWDFGNGSTSFLALPYTVYQNAGTYTVTLTAKYGELTDTATMEITVTDPVYVPPTIKITSPQNLSANFEAPAKLPFRVLANSELGITKVEYWVDGVLIATVTNAPYSYDWNNVSEGTYTIVAKAFDAEGSTESDPVSVTVYPPSEKYKLNGKELSDFGIIAGRAPNSNIAVSGHLDFPKRMGKSFHVWDDEEGVEPYVSYDEIKFEGRDIRFHGYVEGDDKNDVMSKLYAFYDYLNTLNGEVLFSCKWGSWLVIVQSEVEATQIKTGMVSMVVTFRQPDTGIQPIQSGGTADRGIDGISFADLGFTYMNLKNQWYRPTTKDHHAIGYYTEPFQVTKAGAREMVLSGLLETETYQEMVNIVSSLYSLFAKEGVRTLQINNEPFREFFVKDGFQVTNIIIKHQKCMALLSINMMELNKPIFNPDFFTDTDGNYILSNTNQKIIIRK